MTTSDQQQQHQPALCNDCNKSSNLETPHRSCPLCTKLELPESILCDLNRATQEKSTNFICKAFQPKLQLLGKTQTEQSPPKPHEPADNSDSLKYTTALALQKLNRSPDEVSINLRFHLVLNTKFRQKKLKDEDSENIEAALLKCGTNIGGSASLLYIAADHIHIYLQSDGEKSPDSIIGVLQKETKLALGQEELWDQSYFIESMR